MRCCPRKGGGQSNLRLRFMCVDRPQSPCSRTKDSSSRGFGTDSAQNPLPCTEGRGQGEGSDAPIGVLRPLPHRCPLTPTLSPEYRGEGAIANIPTRNLKPETRNPCAPSPIS